MRTALPRCFGIRVLKLLPAVLLFATVGWAQNTTGPTSVFQLNGNPGGAETGNTLISTCDYTALNQQCDYWNLLNPPSTMMGQHSLGSSFRPGPSVDNFTGGGSKDPNTLDNWLYVSGNTPNKDALNDGYVAAYNDSTGDFNLVMGANRFDPKGAANIGIWFFQNSVTLGPVSKSNGTGPFLGSHVNGDLFVIAQFVTGGGVSVPSVYSWNQPGLPNAVNGGCAAGVPSPVPGQCADSNLLLLADPTSGICGSNQPYCSITNSATVTGDWPNSGTMVSPLFWEGGIDVTKALAAVGINTIPCFSSFLEETRSAPSTSATLKDFLLGPFNLCGMNISKTCGTPSVNEGGTAINYPVGGIVTNTGIGTLYGVQVCDTINGAATPTVVKVSNTCASCPRMGTNVLAAHETGTWSDAGSSTASSQSDTAFAVGTTTSGGAVSCSTGPITSAAPEGSATCSLNVSGALSATKTCNTTLVATTIDVQVQVGFSGMVCNNSLSQVTGVGLTENDSSAAGKSSPMPSSTTLGPCESGVDASGACTTNCVGVWDETEVSGVDKGCMATCPPGDTCIPGNCATYSGDYVPTSDTPVSGPGGPGTGPGRFQFSDTVTVSSATAAVGSLTKISGNPVAVCNGTYACAGAMCPICPAGECPTQ